VNPSSWVLQLLAIWRVRPGTYLGDEEVRTVATFLDGYEMCLTDGGDQTAADAKILDELTRHLRDRFKFGASRSWVDIVEELFQTRPELCPSKERRTESKTDGSTRLLYLLLDEFLAARGIDWPERDTVTVGKAYARPITQT
jgi:hypothetical protein